MCIRDRDDDNTNLFALNLAFRSEGTLANDRFGFNQVATTVVQNDVGDDVSIFNYFGTGDQSRIQRRISSINNRIFGIKDSDFPGYTLTDTGVGKTTLTSLNINDEECVTDVTQNWYSDTRTKTSLVPEPPVVIPPAHIPLLSSAKEPPWTLSDDKSPKSKELPVVATVIY